MRRLSKPGGRIVILTQFEPDEIVGPAADRRPPSGTVHIGFKSDLDLPAFLAQAELKPISIQKVNVPRIWSLVTCVKD
jgi:hypothetical protein